MKDFDFNTIGKKMPYEAPSNDFFEEFTQDMLAKVESPRKKSFDLRRLIIPISSIAAILLLGVLFSVTFEKNDKLIKMEYMLADNLDESLDLYFKTLSDDQIETLAYETSYQDDFFANLTNE